MTISLENIQSGEKLLLNKNADRVNAFKSRRAAPFLIEIEPISVQSQLDHRVRVSTFRWAVTLICYKGSDGNHTSIIVEGINNGKFDGLKQEPLRGYFMYKSDFYDTNVVKSELFDDKLPYEQRTEIWKVSSEKVVTMLENIAEQIRRIEKKEEKVKLSIYNPDRITTHNCFTWARGHLKKADIIDLGEKRVFGLFHARAKNYTSYGNSTYVGWGVPFSPTVFYNNIVNDYDYSEYTINYKESL